MQIHSNILKNHSAILSFKQPSKKKKWKFFFVLLLLFSFSSYGQQSNLKFKHLSTDQGLSQSHVLCVLQDSKGFMWFGTADGLNRYDGYDFKVYKNIVGDSTSLPNNYITTICEDSKGALWVGSLGGGLSKLDRNSDKFTIYRHNDKNRFSLSNDNINKILEDSRGNLWIGTNFLIVKRKNFITIVMILQIQIP
jgi:ligand-binding sensor domain-containing protein